VEIPVYREEVPMSDSASESAGGDAHQGDPQIEDRLDEQEIESFPASDPHSDWAGPPG
jgi:hypothetical protein